MKYYDIKEEVGLTSKGLNNLSFKVGRRTSIKFVEKEVDRKYYKDIGDYIIAHNGIGKPYVGQNVTEVGGVWYIDLVSIPKPYILIKIFFKRRKWGTGFKYKLEGLDSENPTIYTNKVGLVIGSKGATIKLLEKVLGKKIAIKELK